MSSMISERDVGLLAQEMYNGYCAYAGIASIARHPHTAAVLEKLKSENSGPAPVPIERVERKDGSAIYYDLVHFVRNVSQSPDYREVHDRLWLSGALLTLGDELARASYFDKGPDLEFIRHLRNGIAHGNRFHFVGNQPSRPAHFTGPEGRFMPADGTTTAPGDSHTFRIVPGLHGMPVLFDFIGPGDICDLLLFVSNRLIRIGNREAPRDLHSQHP